MPANDPRRNFIWQNLMLKSRIITAAILVPVVVGTLLYLPLNLAVAFLLIFPIAAAWEWAALIGWDVRVRRMTYVVLFTLCALTVWHFNDTQVGIRFLVPLGVIWWLMASVLVVLAERQSLGRAIVLGSNAFAGLMVLLPAWAAVIWLLNVDRVMLLVFFVVIWAADGGAYFVGKRWGRSRLAVNVSPGKTWEGAVGGVVGGVCVALIAGFVLVLSRQAHYALIALTFVTVLISIAGDLFESMLKRRIGAKDSGNLLPGHGGVLDRIDGLVAAAPLFATGLNYWVFRL